MSRKVIPCLCVDVLQPSQTKRHAVNCTCPTFHVSLQQNPVNLNPGQLTIGFQCFLKYTKYTCTMHIYSSWFTSTIDVCYIVCAQYDVTSAKLGSFQKTFQRCISRKTCSWTFFVVDFGRFSVNLSKPYVSNYIEIFCLVQHDLCTCIVFDMMCQNTAHVTRYVIQTKPLQNLFN